MKLLGGRRPSAGLPIAVGALVLALGGTGYAALALAPRSVGTPQLRKNAVRSPKVVNGTLRLRDLSTAARTALTGSAGATGPPGDAGAAGTDGATGAAGPGGAADGSFVSNDASTALTNDSVNPVVVATMNVPAGSYTVVAKAVATFSPSAVVAVTCQLVAEGDFDTSTVTVVGTTGTALALQVAHEFAAPGAAVLRCYDAAGADPHAAVTLARVTAVRTSTLSNVASP
jgi:hypothetical protein